MVSLATLRQLALTMPHSYPVPARVPQSHLPKNAPRNGRGTSADKDSSDEHAKMKYPTNLAFVENVADGKVTLRWYEAVNWSKGSVKGVFSQQTLQRRQR